MVKEYEAVGGVRTYRETEVLKGNPPKCHFLQGAVSSQSFLINADCIGD
jgi:hypothetical protein